MRHYVIFNTIETEDDYQNAHINSNYAEITTGERPAEFEKYFNSFTNAVAYCKENGFYYMVPVDDNNTRMNASQQFGYESLKNLFEDEIVEALETAYDDTKGFRHPSDLIRNIIINELRGTQDRSLCNYDAMRIVVDELAKTFLADKILPEFPDYLDIKAGESRNADQQANDYADIGAYCQVSGANRTEEFKQYRTALAYESYESPLNDILIGHVLDSMDWAITREFDTRASTVSQMSAHFCPTFYVTENRDNSLSITTNVLHAQCYGNTYLAWFKTEREALLYVMQTGYTAQSPRDDDFYPAGTTFDQDGFRLVA